MSMTNPAYDACPVGIAVFFPRLTTPPNSDWILCDGSKYTKGTYPKIDAVNDVLTTTYRVDKPVYTVEGTTNRYAVADGISLRASTVLGNYEANGVYKLFQPDYTGGYWAAAAGTPSQDTPDQIQVGFSELRQVTGIELISQSIDSISTFPKVVRIWGTANGEQWDMTDLVTLDKPETGRGVYIPVTNPFNPPVMAFTIDIIDRYEGMRTGLSRLRVFAKDGNNLIAPVIGENLGPINGVWCLRVAR